MQTFFIIIFPSPLLFLALPIAREAGHKSGSMQETLKCFCPLRSDDPRQEGGGWGSFDGICPSKRCRPTLSEALGTSHLGVTSVLRSAKNHAPSARVLARL